MRGLLILKLRLLCCCHLFITTQIETQKEREIHRQRQSERAKDNRSFIIMIVIGLRGRRCWCCTIIFRLWHFIVSLSGNDISWEPFSCFLHWNLREMNIDRNDDEDNVHTWTDKILSPKIIYFGIRIFGKRWALTNE